MLDEKKVLDFPKAMPAGPASADEAPVQMGVVGVEPRFIPVTTPIAADDVFNLISAGWLYWATLPVIPPVREQLAGAPATPVMTHIFYRPVFGPVN